MTELKKLAFVVDEFALGTPAQQLLDRFLLGYPRDGTFHRPGDYRVHVLLRETRPNADLERRVQEHGLILETQFDQLATGTDGIMVVPRGAGFDVDDAVVSEVLQTAPKGSGCFVHGVLASTLAKAKDQVALANSREIRLLSGTSISTTWRLPEIEIPRQKEIHEALIVVQGTAPGAELEALDGILSCVQPQSLVPESVRSVQFLGGEKVWESGKSGLWSWDLLAAALSRSDSPQGDPVKDGRTQDLVGLGLVSKLARAPRAWIIEQENRRRLALLVLDGVVADYNCALRLDDRSIISAQLYRPPKPAQHQFSWLTSRIEDYFRNAGSLWPVQRSLLTTALMEKLQIPSFRSGERIEITDIQF